MAEPVLPEALWERVRGVPGWLYEGEADLLYRFVDGPWCEVGSYCGRSALVLAARHPEGWCIDSGVEVPDVLKGALQENLSAYPDVRVIIDDFRYVPEHVPEGLQLVHLDADHSFDATCEAYDLYAPKVRRGGYLVVHDAWEEGHPGDLSVPSAWPEVTRFVKQVVLQDEGWGRVEDVERTAVFRRR